MSTWAAGLVCAVAIVGQATRGVAAEKSGVLDSKTFVGEVGDKGKPATPDKEEVSFKAGRFHSKGCDPFGFGDAPYKATVKDGVTTFEAQTLSAKEGKIDWKGTVKGDAIDATFVWTKPAQAPLEYWLKGTLKK